MIRKCSLDGCNIDFTPVSTVHRFCSEKHRSIASRERRKAGNYGCEKPCARDECDKVFLAKDKRQKYCSHSCAAITNNRKYPKRTRHEDRQCPCGSLLKTHQKTYCSRSHAGLYRNSGYIERWLVGLEDGSKKNGSLSVIVRNYLLRESNFSCSECGWSKPNPVTGKPILTIDHQDGNWKNNQRGNLVVLCYNCHSLTETFGALNVGSESGRRPWAAVR